MIEAFFYLAACMLAAFCGGTETAFSAASRIVIAASEKRGKRALWFLEKPSRYLVTTLVGTNVGVVLASNVGHSWGDGLGGAWKVFFAVITAVFLLVFSEIVPKQLALFRSNGISISAAPFLFLVRILLFPLIAAASFISRLITGTSDRSRFFESREEIKGLLTSSGGKQGRTASAVISLGNAPVGDYARPLSEYPSVDAAAGRDQAVRVLLESGEDFILVWEEPETTLLGTVRGSSLVRWDGSGSITSRASGLPYFNAGFPALKVLPQLWRSGATAAVILDARGQPASLVTPDVILSHLIPEE